MFRFVPAALAAAFLAACAASPAVAVTLVEPGHVLVKHADSVAPLHPSQGQLGFTFEQKLESIAVHPTTGMVYLQRMDMPFGCPTDDTAIFSFDPTTGVVSPLNLSTGFGICERGSDLGVDPTRNLLIAQDADFASPGGSVVTVDIGTGATGTWVTPSVFNFNTFGMQLSNGIGTVPAGDLIYLADLGGGMNSAPFGGPNTLEAPFPGGGGDDLYQQPDGDVVFLGDGGELIWVFDPFTWAPTPTALDAFSIFSDAGLPVTCGTRGTVCSTTGEGFLTLSCAPGGAGIFRLDEALTTATLLVETEGPFEGIEDVYVGPASDGGPNGSLWFVVTRDDGSQQVWELTDVCPGTNAAPSCDAGGPYSGSCDEAVLDGITVDDPDGDDVSWTVTSGDPDVSFAPDSGTSAPGALPPIVATLAAGVAPCGVTADVTVTVTDDSGDSSSCTTTVTFDDDEAPTLVDVPLSVTVECDAVPPPAPVSAADTCDASPSLDFTETRVDGACPGEYQLVRTWTATDACSNTTSATQTVTVVDTTPPVVTAGAGALACLWPPNHRYVCFDAADLDVTATDACSEPVTWSVVGCASSQPDEAPESGSDWNGDGSFEDDCVVSPDGSSFCVRAERAGAGAAAQGGRSYGILVVATDACGNVSEPTVAGTIEVGHDRSPAAPGCLDTTEVGLRPNEPLPW